MSQTIINKKTSKTLQNTKERKAVKTKQQLKLKEE